MEKPTSTYKARQFIAIVVVFVCLMMVVVAASPSKLPAPITKATTGKEDIIQQYITYLSEAGDPTNTNRAKTLNIELHGMGTESSALPTMSLKVAETAGLLSPVRGQDNSTAVRTDEYASVAVQQHHLVITQFGSDAWNNVTYTLDEIDPVDGVGYRNISTGELISESEYTRLLRHYWESVADQEGVTYYDIFLADGEPVERMENKRVDIIAKYSGGIPVELTTISSDVQTYRVNLSFNGERVSSQEYADFHFIIHNRNGYWSVFQGLTWAEPYPELPEGD